jgi:hypothetical protein
MADRSLLKQEAPPEPLNALLLYYKQVAPLELLLLIDDSRGVTCL